MRRLTLRHSRFHATVEEERHLGILGLHAKSPKTEKCGKWILQLSEGMFALLMDDVTCMARMQRLFTDYSLSLAPLLFYTSILYIVLVLRTLVPSVHMRVLRTTIRQKFQPFMSLETVAVVS